MNNLQEKRTQLAELAEGVNQVDYLKAILKDILQEALTLGATSAEVDMGVNKGFSVTAHQGDVESIEYHQDKSIDITVYFGKRLGTVSLSDLREEAIRSGVKAACDIARFTDQDEYAGLADKDLLAFHYPTLDLSQPWNITVDQAIEMTKACEAKALSCDKRLISSEGAVITTSQALHLYGNTEGFMGAFPTTRHELSCVLVAKEGDEMQRDYSYTVSTDPDWLESPEKVAEKAAEKTVRRLGARRLSTRRAPVLFIAEEARGLLGYFISAISGGSLYRKSSFLLDSLGKPVFPTFIKIDEHPHLPKGLGSAPFDNNGVATRANVFVADGLLTSYALGIYAARKLGMKTTGNAGGVHNVFISTGKKTFTELLKMMNSGLVVVDLMGQGVNIVTGDYSRGAFGFWVENGEIQYPVEEVTIAGNLRDMYTRIVEVGADVDKRGNIQTGSILIEEMTIAGH